MPCNCDHLEPSQHEIELSRVFSLLDEIDNTINPIEYMDGYHPKAYNKTTKERLDEATKKLCSILSSKDVTKYSLEMQLWWRNHQIADVKRLKKEESIALRNEEVKAALAKLTEYEKRILGFL